MLPFAPGIKPGPAEGSCRSFRPTIRAAVDNPYPAAVTEAMLEADQASRVTRHEARRIDLLVALAVSDLRARYGRGSVEVVKWLLDPFFAAGVY